MRGATAMVAVILLAAAAPPEPDDYRTSDYSAPAPATLRDAHVLSVDQARALWDAKRAVFVDVLPQAPRPANLPAGTLWRDRPHADIPGSIWLPDTGYGVLAPMMRDYFAHNLEAATGGDRDRALVFYCKPDCWMSWNAAKRALALGYHQVDWFPAGEPGWQQAGLPVEPRIAEPRPRQ